MMMKLNNDVNDILVVAVNRWVNKNKNYLIILKFKRFSK